MTDKSAWEITHEGAPNELWCVQRRRDGVAAFDNYHVPWPAFLITADFYNATINSITSRRNAGLRMHVRWCDAVLTGMAWMPQKWRDAVMTLAVTADETSREDHIALWNVFKQGLTEARKARRAAAGL